MKEKSAPEQIDDIIALYGGWKGDTLARIRAIIMSTDDSIFEEVKWKMRSRPEGLPVWSYKGMLCRTETFKDNMKLVFSKGAQMDAYQRSFNARLNSSTDRAIEYREGESVDESALVALVHEALRLNKAKAEKGK